jgi:hypothetical protein
MSGLTCKKGMRLNGRRRRKIKSAVRIDNHGEYQYDKKNFDREICDNCHINDSAIFQAHGKFCLECWQVMTYP